MRHPFIFLFASLVILVGWLSIPATRSQGPIKPVTPAQEPAFQLLGASSCASTACHNSGDASRIKGREYAICLTDKHDRAYAVLLSERSKKMEQHVYRLDDWRTAHPELDLLCLKCHVHPELDRAVSKEVDGIRQFRLEDAVSCEACHGPAQRWIDVHHRPEWQALSATEKQAHYGMNDTRNVLGRTRVCVTCHVGAPGMDVNHDLLAAGHPRLAFDFSSYHSLMTKHWDEARDRDPARGGTPDFEAHAWMTGQLATLKASLELLDHRRTQQAWPEFAEFDCYACHHDLRNAGAKQDRAFPGRVAGTLSWNRWSTAQAETALALLAGHNDPAIAQGLEAIRQEMQKPIPSQETLGREISKAVRLLEQALQKAPANLRDMPVRDAMARIANKSAPSWDDAAQTFIGLTAWERTRQGRRQPEIAGLRPNLEALRILLLPDARYRLKEVEETTGRIAKQLQTDGQGR